MKKILPIKQREDIKLFTHHAIPMQIPMVCNLTMGWYMSCFVNIVYKYDKTQYFNYTDYKMFYQYAIDKDILSNSAISDINDKENFLHFIEQEKYIYAWIDQYYVSTSVYGGKVHDIHPMMIYGVDEEADVYYCVAFSLSKSVYTLEVKREEYHTALKELLKHWVYINDDDLFILYKLRDNGVADFVLEYFINELKNYTDGCGVPRTAYYTYNTKYDKPDRFNRSAGGIEVTRVFYEMLGQELDQGKEFDYRILHMICENKKLIADRLQYMLTKYEFSEKIKCLVDQYAVLSTEYQNIRLLSYKYSLYESCGRSTFWLPNNEKHISSLCKKMKSLYEKEKVLLRELLPLLQVANMEWIFSDFEIHKSETSGEEMIVELDEERYVDSVIIYNDYKKYCGKVIIDGEEISEHDIDYRSLHNFYVVPVNRKIKSCRYIPNKNIGETFIWLLEPNKQL